MNNHLQKHQYNHRLSKSVTQELLLAYVRQDHLKRLPTFEKVATTDTETETGIATTTILPPLSTASTSSAVRVSTGYKCTTKFGVILKSDRSNHLIECNSKPFATFRALYYHFSLRHNYKNCLYACFFDEQVFLTHRLLVEHLNSRCSNNLFRCSGCECRYKSFRALYNHSNKKHPNTPIFYPCLDCTALFYNKVSMV